MTAFERGDAFVLLLPLGSACLPPFSATGSRKRPDFCWLVGPDRKAATRPTLGERPTGAGSPLPRVFPTWEFSASTPQMRPTFSLRRELLGGGGRRATFGSRDGLADRFRRWAHGRAATQRKHDLRRETRSAWP